MWRLPLCQYLPPRRLLSSPITQERQTLTMPETQTPGATPAPALDFIQIGEDNDVRIDVPGSLRYLGLPDSPEYADWAMDAIAAEFLAEFPQAKITAVRVLAELPQERGPVCL